mmetsp:Transcript_80246/g.233000  ORF Transcript_80246/g.233000 Transcript_80246/m.233000 type:complete len:207 (-) Transcript_80246:552-1172(-)
MSTEGCERPYPSSTYCGAAMARGNSSGKSCPSNLMATRCFARANSYMVRQPSRSVSANVQILCRVVDGNLLSIRFCLPTCPATLPLASGDIAMNSSLYFSISGGRYQWRFPTTGSAWPSTLTPANGDARPASCDSSASFVRPASTGIISTSFGKSTDNMFSSACIFLLLSFLKELNLNAANLSCINLGSGKSPSASPFSSAISSNS